MDGLIDEVLDVDPARLSHDERLELLERIEHTRSALDAKAQITLALLAGEGDAEARAKEWVREEIACALSIAPATAASRLHDATELIGRLPLTLDRLVDGSITMGHARVLVEACRALDDDTVAKVEHRVIGRATGQPIGVFRQSVKRAVLSLDPRRAEEQHRAAAEQRRVSMRPDEHGMAGVYAYLRADQALGLMTSLDAHAATLPHDDGRSADQKRADVLADLAALALNNAATSWQGRRPAVQVSVALSTLLDIDEQPGELDGYGPIPAAMARAIAYDPTGTWRRLVTDPLGRLVRCDTHTYRPPAPLREHIIATYRTCTFPGCRRSACRGEIDHIRPYGSGGGTVEENLHPPCKRHHLMKHRTKWRVGKRTDAITWTSPTGRSYETPVHAYPVDRTRDPDPPPF